MGGGHREPAGDSAEHEALLQKFQDICKSGPADLPGADCRDLEEGYLRVDKILMRQQNGKQLLDKCAAHVEMTERLRLLAGRYKAVEMTSLALVEGSLNIAEGLMTLTAAVREAMETNAPRPRVAVQEAAKKLETLSTIVEAAAAVHRAVGRDLDAMVARAREIADNPSKADVGFKAAPILGGAAGSAIAFCLRVAGPIGAVGALAIIGAGALGGSGMATALYPQTRKVFLRLEEEIAQVAGQVHSKAAALETLAADLSATGSQLASTVDIIPDGSYLNRRLLEEGLAETTRSLEGVVHRCMGCQYRTSAFLSIDPPST